MNYIYLAVGLIAGIFFLGKARSTSRRKMIPYEVTRELKSSNRMDDSFRLFRYFRRHKSGYYKHTLNTFTYCVRCRIHNALYK